MTSRMSKRLFAMAKRLTYIDTQMNMNPIKIRWGFIFLGIDNMRCGQGLGLSKK